MSQNQSEFDDFRPSICRWSAVEDHSLSIPGGQADVRYGIGAYLTAAFALQGGRVSFVALREAPAQLRGQEYSRARA